MIISRNTGSNNKNTRYSTETWGVPPSQLILASSMVNDSEQLKQICVEDYSEERGDHILVRDYLKPYLRDLYADLVMRNVSNASPKAGRMMMLDKLAFISYTRLPLLVAERLFHHFQETSTAPGATNNTRGSSLSSQKLEKFISEDAFVTCACLVFAGGLMPRIELCFRMYVYILIIGNS